MRGKGRRRVKEKYVSQFQETHDSRFVIREMKPAKIKLRGPPTGAGKKHH